MRTVNNKAFRTIRWVIYSSSCSKQQLLKTVLRELTIKEKSDKLGYIKIKILIIQRHH